MLYKQQIIYQFIYFENKLILLKTEKLNKVLNIEILINIYFIFSSFIDRKLIIKLYKYLIYFQNYNINY
jgi:hypothetical protein